MTVTSPTPTYAQQPTAPDSLSQSQVRNLVLRAADKIEQLEAQNKAAGEYIVALEKKGESDAALVKAQQDSIELRQTEINSLRDTIGILREALTVSEKATATAVKEADRQRKRAGRWKTLAKIGTVAGIMIGAGAVLMIQR